MWFEGFVHGIYVQTRFIPTLLGLRALLKITLFSSDVLFVLLLSRLLFWASGIAKICTNFIWGQLCVKVKVVPFLFQAFRFNFANYKTHASIFIGISKQMKSSPFSSWSFHLGLKTWFWWVSWPLTTFDNMFDITPCWPSWSTIHDGTGEEMCLMITFQESRWLGKSSRWGFPCRTQGLLPPLQGNRL